MTKPSLISIYILAGIILLGSLGLFVLNEYGKYGQFWQLHPWGSYTHFALEIDFILFIVLAMMGGKIAQKISGGRPWFYYLNIVFSALSLIFLVGVFL